MKKSVLALAVAGVMVASSVASAAVVYDKDGTQMTIGGRVEAMWGSTHSGGTGAQKDHTIRDRVRLNVGGRTKLTDWATGYGFWETQQQHWGGNGSKEDGETSLRTAYVGVDFGKFGSLQAGRWEDWVEYTGNLVDWLEDDGCNSQVGRDRNSGKIGYQWSGYGVDAKLSYQTAVNNYGGLQLLSGAYDAQSGFTAALGYTSPDVLFGPISVRTSYQYMKAQAENDGAVDGNVKNTKLWEAGIAWGKMKKGPYIGAVYSAAKANFHGETKTAAEMKSFEVLVGYGFSNGVAVRAAYAYKDIDHRMGMRETTNGLTANGKMKLLSVVASYDINKNFRVWGEAHFDCSSDDGYGKWSKDEGAIGEGANVYKIGARYSF